MRYLVILLLAFVISNISRAQFQEPNYDGISRIIKDNSSPYFYDTLFSRYESNDTSLTVQHYRILYYGYIYQENYDPYGIPVQFDSLNQILAKENLNTSDYYQIIGMETNVLKDFPFNLREISLLAKAYEETNQTALAKATHDKFNKIAQAILSTGDGRTMESAMHVIINSHEYDILHFLDLEYANDSKQIEDTYEYLSVKQNSFDVAGIYFNIKKMFEHEEKLLGK